MYCSNAGQRPSPLELDEHCVFFTDTYGFKEIVNFHTATRRNGFLRAISYLRKRHKHENHMHGI